MTRLIRGLHNLKNQVKGSVVTLGNFDGVHIGHQALLAEVTATARRLNTTSLAMIFEPQPFEFFAREKVAPRLTRWREKFQLLSAYGVDAVLVIRFNAAFAAFTAEQFIQQILVDALAVKAIIVGDDFHFGRQRQGNFALLQQAGNKYDFRVMAMPTIQLNQQRVSSTVVRQALETGDQARVAQLLGRPYTMIGRVVYGDQRGRQLGFPTANIFLHRQATPVQGVYAVRMHGVQKKSLPGVANIGTRPTIDGTKTLLEVHLFDFNQEIYGQHVTVEFCAKLRDEKRFENIGLLKEQIARDALAARHYFELHGEVR